jgi:RNA polymerase sigma-70 factor, ECF subfamily
MDDTPRSLLVRLRESPGEADWRRFDDLYRPFLLKSLACYDVPLPDAEDLTQEILGTVLSAIPTFQLDPDRGRFRSWLRTILINKLRPYWRSRRTQSEVNGNGSHENVLDQLADPASELSVLWDREHDQHLAVRLQESVRSDFDPLTWEAFRRRMEGESTASVASSLGMSNAAVAQAKARVLKRLRHEATGLLD